ncbi:hypothetical protein L6164_029510 [Bauhinia variegata]|uniref:Uncharacterized protein n=1 Tax=Bauhinia variegata TaxID=167791 RepID=A0ACB9L9V2_BAUVA|nr:hypothetical protein L6164_029510 [Bauhinia variegata]
MLAETSGDGTSAAGGAPAGVEAGLLAGVAAGVATGVATGEAAVGEREPLVDGLGAGEAEDGEWAVGDFAGVAPAGVGTDPDGDIVGVDVGGDKFGDFAGDGVGLAGDCVGEVGGVGDFAGGGMVVDPGEGAGALSACTNAKKAIQRPNMESTSNVFIFGTWKN